VLIRRRRVRKTSMYARRKVTKLTRKLRRDAGRWLRELREKRGLTQRELAQKVRAKDHIFVSLVENGWGRIPPDRLRVWATALGVDPREFALRLMSYYEPVTYRILFGRGPWRAKRSPARRVH
jgi:transcriptional regulator with XRE-family HTH domain